MSSKVQEWLQKGEIIAAREIFHKQYSKPADIYTICGDSVEDALRTTATRKQQNLPKKHYHKKLSSSDSSVIPFAETNDTINPPRGYIMDGTRNDSKQSKQRFENNHESSEERSPKVDGRKTKDFQRRPRHKIRSPSKKPIAELKKAERRVPVMKKKSSRLKNKKQGDVLIDEFSADNVAKDRLTLRPSHNLGIFKKGRASTPVKKGLPDLAFSEMRFLDGRSFDLPIGQKTSPKRKKDKKSQSRKDDNESFSYFESSKRRLEERRMRAITISSDGYTDPRKRRKKAGKSTPKKRLFEAPMTESPIRPSPRSAMAHALRRKGIYSLPANISSRESNCGSTVISGRNLDGSSSGEDVDGNKSTDEHSEYSRVGFQKRFKPKWKDSSHLQKGGTSNPTTEPLKYVKVYNTNVTERDGSYPCSEVHVVRDKKLETEGADRAINGALEIVRTNNRSSASKNRCTPEPAKLQKIPGSSSPLAALLRVCADSPEKLGTRGRHDRSRDDKVEPDNHKPSRSPKRPVFYPQKSVLGQSSVAYEDCLSLPSRTLNVPRTRQLMKIEGLHQECNYSGELLDHYAISPHALCAKAGKHSLDEVQENKKFRDLDGYDHAMGSSSENYINENNIGDYAYGYPESPLLEAIEERYLSELGTHEYTRDREGQEIVEDSFTDSSSDYSPEDLIDDPNTSCLSGGSSEERQVHDFGHPYVEIGWHQREQRHIEDIRHDGGCVQQELEDPGPKRENFWRKHTL